MNAQAINTPIMGNDELSIMSDNCDYETVSEDVQDAMYESGMELDFD